MAPPGLVDRPKGACMPNAPAHPEAKAEAENLTTTITILDRRTEEVAGMPVYGPTEYDTASLHAHINSLSRGSRRFDYLSDLPCILFAVRAFASGQQGLQKV